MPKIGFIPVFFTFLVKLNRAIEISVVCECECGHFKINCFFDERVNFREPVKQRIVRMGMQVDEFHKVIVSLKMMMRKREKIIVGIDEAGRGPLAGPMVIAAVAVLGSRSGSPTSKGRSDFLKGI